jgi:hypothetical protein
VALGSLAVFAAVQVEQAEDSGFTSFVVRVRSMRRDERQCASLRAYAIRLVARFLIAFATGLAVGSSPWGAPRWAHAADPALDRARALAAEAESQFRAGAFREAADLYARAHGLAPSASVKFSEASSWLRAGDEPAAADAYEAALKLGTLDADRTETARELLAELRAKLGILVVAEPAGAEINVAHARARTIPARVHVSPGRHEVEIVRRDGSVLTESVELSMGETRHLRFPDSVAMADPPTPRRPDVAEPRSGPSWVEVSGWTLVAIGATNAIAAVPLGVAFVDQRSTFIDEGQTDADQRDQVVVLQGFTTAAILTAAAAGGIGAVFLIAAPGDDAEAELVLVPAGAAMRLSF